MAETKVTQAELSLGRTVDANGWTVFDYGTWKEYRKRVSFTNTIGATATASLSISSTNLPTGVSTLGTNFFNYSATLSGFSMYLTVVAEMTSASTALLINGRNSDSSSHAFTGIISLALII